MLKRGRASVHEQYADWLSAHEADRLGEVEEVIAYHLEQAHVYLRGLGPLDDHGRDSPGGPRALLLGAGRRAFAREDLHATASLLRRAVDLAPDATADRRGAQLLLAEALDEVGAFADAGTLLDEVEAAATVAGDERSSLAPVCFAFASSSRPRRLPSGRPGRWMRLSGH